MEALKRTVPAQDLDKRDPLARRERVTTRDLIKVDHPQHGAHLGIGARREVATRSWTRRHGRKSMSTRASRTLLIILGHKLRNVTVTRDFDRTPSAPLRLRRRAQTRSGRTSSTMRSTPCSGTGRIDVRTRRDGEFFLVEIADNGGGIPPEARPLIFAVPFFTTKGRIGHRTWTRYQPPDRRRTASRKNRLQHRSEWHAI